MKAGTSVALPRIVMLLAELTIIYLAAAAPFAASRFLRDREQCAQSSKAFLRAVAASLAWPATALLSLTKNAADARNGEAPSDVESHIPDERSVERAGRATVNALRAVEDLLAGGRDFEAVRRALFAARESVERYAGLALACASARVDAEPAPRELELCRIAGRAGQDLLVAGRCVHRRNVTRLLAHRERARCELVHSLAAAREAAHSVYPSQRQTYSAASADGANARRVSEALLDALARAVELLSLFDEREAVVSVARLLDAECARLRRVNSRTADGGGHAANEGGESCTTPAAHTAFAATPLPTTTSTGG